MITMNELNIIDYVEELERENKLLKERILKNIKNENTEIVKLNFTINILIREIEKLKLKRQN